MGEARTRLEKAETELDELEESQVSTIVPSFLKVFITFLYPLLKSFFSFDISYHLENPSCLICRASTSWTQMQRWICWRRSS